MEKPRPRSRFQETGLRLSGKYRLLKIVSLRRQGVDLKDGLWLPSTTYVAMRLTGKTWTVLPSSRTYVYSLAAEDWDRAVVKGCPSGVPGVRLAANLGSAQARPLWSSLGAFL